MAAQAKQNPAPVAPVVAKQEASVIPQEPAPTVTTAPQDVNKPIITTQERTSPFFKDLSAASQVKRDTSRFGYMPDLNTRGLSKAEKQLVKEIKKQLKSHPVLNEYWLEFDAQIISMGNLEELKNLLGLSATDRKNAPQKTDKTALPYYTLQQHNLFGTRFNVINVTLPQSTQVIVNPIRRSVTLGVK